MLSGCFPVAGWLRRRRLARQLDAAIADGQVTLPPGMSVYEWLQSPAGRAWLGARRARP